MNRIEALDLIKASAKKYSDAEEGLRIVTHVLIEYDDTYGDQLEGPFFEEPEGGWKYEYEVYRLVDMILALDLLPELLK